MATKILFNFASRQRPKRFQTSIDNLLSLLNNKQDYSLCVKLDVDDLTVMQYHYLNECTFIGESLSKVHAINRNIPKDEWDILVNMSDDIRWTAQGFDDVIREHCGPDDFVLFPEPYANRQMNKRLNGLISVVSVIGFDYYKRDGYVYHPSYKRTHCDNEATEVARKRGRLKQVDIELFYHEHPAAGYPVGDSLYKKEKETWGEDAANYRKRKAINFGL